jgi:uncharacterized repeat protein (TIGR01451 family)
MPKTTTCILVGLFILALLILVCLPQPAIATEPTPTPMMTPLASPSEASGDGICHLELGTECDFITPFDLAISGSDLKTNPALGARGVPTYTLVSITFDQDMDARTINGDTFYLYQDSTRIGGSVDYIPISKIAVFHPDPPLRPNTTYTATVTAEVQDLAGQPLTENIEWAFTTFSGPVRFGDEVGPADVPVGGLTVYFGDLHTHSGYADDDYLPGTPAQAFMTARANGLDFMALTGHDTHLNQARWQEILVQANAATVNGTFIGLRGFEFTHPHGHLNVLETDSFVSWTGYSDLIDFYAWLLSQPNAIGQFNHPWPGLNFYNFAYYGDIDQKIVLREMLSADQTLLSLNQGWHVGNLLNSDTHVANWGAQKFMGLLASSLTEEAILEAVRARRTFYVSPNGQNVALVMRANGYWMGSAIPNTGTINFVVNVYDPNATGNRLRLALYDNGVRVLVTSLSTYPGTAMYTWTPGITGKLGHYYYAEAYYDDWWIPAYSSPIWVEQIPVAEAGAAQTVRPGVVVTLDGSSSWDPDGDALAYQWSQDSGPLASLNGANTAQPTFIAPDTLGDAVFRLAVTDPGGLSDADTTVVTVTDKPILSITKSGPATARPGELITYTLTITNSGATTATGVVITDAVPVGATYIDGGTLVSSNVVSWELSSLAANEGVNQVTFTVTANQAIANLDYRVSCAEGVSAVGTVPVLTNWRKYYLPIMMKSE